MTIGDSCPRAPPARVTWEQPAPTNRPAFCPSSCSLRFHLRQGKRWWVQPSIPSPFPFGHARLQGGILRLSARDPCPGRDQRPTRIWCLGVGHDVHWASDGSWHSTGAALPCRCFPACTVAHFFPLPSRSAQWIAKGISACFPTSPLQFACEPDFRCRVFSWPTRAPTQMLWRTLHFCCKPCRPLRCQQFSEVCLDPTRYRRRIQGGKTAIGHQIMSSDSR